jgi:hypothetical protein
VEPEHQAAVKIKPQRPAFRFTAGSAMDAPFNLSQDIVTYTLIRTIAPQNAVPSGECGLKRMEGAASPALAGPTEGRRVWL